MKISFIIPVYNAEKYVAGCIDSLYRQGLSNDEFEIICINDDSTDNSLSVLQMYANSNTNVKIKNQTRQGVSCARNAGISMARGQYIWFIDADDYIANNVVGKLLSLAYQYDLDMLFTAHIPTDREDCYDSTFGEYPQTLHVKTGREFFGTEGVNNSACYYFIKKEFVDTNSIRFVEGRYCEDGLFTLSSIQKAKRVAQCNVDVYRYVSRPNSTVHNYTKEHQAKLVDDFCFAVLYINQMIYEEKETSGDTAFIERLTQRRDSYVFFMQVRMVRHSIANSKVWEYINVLEENGCFPNKGLAPHYGWKLVFLSKIFNIRSFYWIIFYLFKFTQSIKNKIKEAK